MNFNQYELKLYFSRQTTIIYKPFLGQIIVHLNKSFKFKMQIKD